MGTDEATRFVLLGDQPHSAVSDPLDFETIVEGLMDLILRSRDATPFTLGVEGTWGTGKSTLMGGLRRRLSQHDEVTTVGFNAWTAQEGKVVEAFVKTVLGAVKPRYLRSALYRRKAIGLVRFVLSSLAGFVGQSRTVEGVWDSVASDPQARNELRDLIQVTVEGWRKGPGKEGRLLCAFVDDLDRCSPVAVLEVLEGMKLYLDVPGLVFVVGYDEAIISEAVLQDKGYSTKTRARDYLEKFIQISYRIPPSLETQAKALVASLLRASGTDRLLGEAERRLVIEGSESNPRSIKRFINRFVLAYGLDPRWREVDPQGLVRALLLQIYFPEFARMLERPNGDPVGEFLEYVEARDALQREVFDSGVQQSSLEEALQRYGLPKPTEGGRQPKEVLGMLDEKVRVEFPELADRQEFVLLVRELSTGKDWEALRSAFSRGELARIDAEDTQAEPFWRMSGVDQRRILWVDDDMEGNRRLVKTLEDHGAFVATAASTEEFKAALENGIYEVLVSDIRRGEDPDAGFTALREARADPELEVPLRVVFFAGVISSERAKTAKALHAEITNDADALLDFIAATPRDER